MNIFCLLWIPLFFFFWIALVPYEISINSALALILGSVSATLQFFFGNLMDSGAFGWERWAGIFVDMVGVPVLLPLFVYALFLLLRIARDPTGFGGFSLLWLVPAGILRTVQWSVERDPAKLVLIPILWTSIAVCVSLFINLCIGESRKKIVIIILSILGILIITPLAATVYWAFYSQKTPLLSYGILVGTLALPVLARAITWRFLVTQVTQERVKNCLTERSRNADFSNLLD
jgi:hypothetical protein